MGGGALAQLEVWEAEYFVAVNTDGKTCPMQIDCSRRLAPDQPKQKRPYLVKSVGHPEVTEPALLFECVGNILAQHFGIQTPHPALIDLSQEFVAAAAAHPDITRNGINLRAGLGVGVEYLAGLAPIQKDVLLQLPRELSQAAAIYAFDMLVQNPDRTRGRKTNCALRNGNLLAFDFELCFSFTRLLFGAPEPWKVDAQMSREHLFFLSLRRKTLDWSRFIQNLHELSDDKIDQLFASLPPSWMAHAPKIAQHLAAVRAHADEFQKELDRSLLT